LIYALFKDHLTRRIRFVSPCSQKLSLGSSLFKHGQIELLFSEALLYEGEQGSISVRKEHTSAVLAKAEKILIVTENEKLRAAEIMEAGIIA